MAEWFGSMGTAGKLFTLLAIPSTLILFIQLFTALTGANRDPAYNDGIKQPLFGVRVVMTGLCACGWTGLILSGTRLPLWAVIAIAAAAGAAATAAGALVSRAFSKHRNGR